MKIFQTAEWFPLGETDFPYNIVEQFTIISETEEVLKSIEEDEKENEK